MGIKWRENLSEFLEAVASSDATPGGGSVAALCGALSAALSRMVAGLAIGKDEYGGVQGDVKKICDEGKVLQSRLSELIDEDSEAYEAVISAMRMPKNSPEEREKRSASIQIALKRAAEVPLETMEKCLEALALSKKAMEKGHRNAITDAGTAASIAHAGLKSAGLNVKINLLSIKNVKFCEDKVKEIEILLYKATRLSKEIESLLGEQT